MLTDLWDIDCETPLAEHPLNRGRAFWHLALPGRYGIPVARDLVKNWPVTLTSIPAGYGWTPADYPGGGGSIHLDGSAGYVSIADAPSLRPALLTVAASFLFRAFNTGTGAGNAIICKPLFQTGQTNGWTNPYLSYLLRANSTANTWEFGMSYGSASYSSLKTAYTFSLNTWYRGFGLFSGSTQACYLFQGNKLVASNSASVTGTIQYNSTPLYLGTDGAANSDVWDRSDCLIDNAFVANRAYSLAEIKLDNQLARQGYPGVLRRRRGSAMFLSAPATAATLFRRTLSGQGARVGSRQAMRSRGGL